MSSPMESVKHLRIRLNEIMKATNNFNEENVIAKGELGSVYKGKLSLSDGLIIDVAVKKLDLKSDQGSYEFFEEIKTLSFYKNENVISFVGFCDEDNEKILVYKHDETSRSLNELISSTDLTWRGRLKVSIDIARGLNYLHTEVGPQYKVLHRAVKSANILLINHGEWEARVSAFGLSRIAPPNLHRTPDYLDPEYSTTKVLNKKSDVYSFGLVLFELLCGRPVIGEYHLAPLVRKKYVEDKLDDIIQHDLRKQMTVNSLDKFAMVAYRCIKLDPNERPTMACVIQKLNRAFLLQTCSKVAEIARVGIWGTKCIVPENHWAFLLEKDHKLKTITINHCDVIDSIIFTTESEGKPYHSKAGGGKGGGKPDEIPYEDDDEIFGINGTVGKIEHDLTVISSLSFVTNKKPDKTFGKQTDDKFSVSWDKGTFGGFYGLGGDYIDGIGVYVKASSEDMITQVGMWGAQSPGGPDNHWSFKLKNNHRLKKISIDHGHLIYSLVFTPEYRGIEQTPITVGGWNGGKEVTPVIFEWDEEIIGITGSVGVEKSTYTIISSISFITNKNINGHGPYGLETENKFSVPWEEGTFAGFYGLAGYYLDSIGVYLKPTISYNHSTKHLN